MHNTPPHPTPPYPALIVVPRVNLMHNAPPHPTLPCSHCYSKGKPGTQAFSCAGPTLWNSLPVGLRTQRDSRCFKRDLKTIIFNQVFSEFYVYSSTCLQRTLLYPSKSVPTWQVSPHRRDRHVGMEGSVLPIYGRHMHG